MPRSTSRTFSSRLAIIFLSTFAAIATEFGIATALADKGGYVFMASYRIDTIIATIWCAIGIFLLSIYDVYTYNNLPTVIERRAARSRQARRDGKPAPKVPSTLLVALKKSMGPIFAVFTCCLYGTVVPMAFQAAKTDAMRLAVYSSAMVYKTGCEFLFKKMMEKEKVKIFLVILYLFSFELITTTQIRILLSSSQNANLVLYASIASAFYEFCVRNATLFNLRRQMSELKSRGVDAENTQLLVRKATIFTAVSRLRKRCVPLFSSLFRVLTIQNQHHHICILSLCFVLRRKHTSHTNCMHRNRTSTAT